MGRMISFLKNWMLVIAMCAGISMYLIYVELDFLHQYGSLLLGIVKFLQPLLLFIMLFLSFCKISPRQLKLRGWHFTGLLLQCVLYIICMLSLVFFKDMMSSLPLLQFSVEAFALCIICPTATACSVLTAKLGGDRASVMTYTILINLMVAIVVPLLVPLVNPMDGHGFVEAFLKILSKVFPMLILPCLLAWFLQVTAPKLHDYFAGHASLAFNIWAISLTLAMLMSTRAIYHSGAGIVLLSGIAFASLLSCILQFWCGKRIGGRNGDRISAGQALGQKNTVFAIWLAYTFMNPLVSVAGGFYSIWHNVFNSWQLYRQRRGKLY